MYVNDCWKAIGVCTKIPIVFQNWSGIFSKVTELSKNGPSTTIRKRRHSLSFRKG